MKKQILVAVLFVFTASLFSQTNGSLDTVKVKVVCSGETENQAITEGLRSALTQVSGVFISSNTSIIDDQIAKDQITMINIGSIIEYKILEKLESEKQFTLALEVGVSINKLGSFVTNSGGETELQGGLFAANIKLNELNEKAELQSMVDLLEICDSLVAKCFDYEIKNGEPKNENGLWAIPLTVVQNYTVLKHNKNIK